MMRNINLPRLYTIVDTATLGPHTLLDFVKELLGGGVRLIQYRNKAGSAREMLDQARWLRRLVGERAQLILNDRADLALAADCAGVHLGQDDLSAEGARAVGGERLLVGVSCHNVEQVKAANAGPADYIAIGPLFATTSKARPDPVVGLEGVRAARAITRKPLVAIGGITRANCVSVIETGADSLAVISDLVTEPKKAAQDFLRLLK
ncbi:MAG: thiamine phosphate synthase [Acidobacteria bacterium]|nr:thiamine phosphate synthase [Acidobacteriota bacterium]